MRRGGKIRRMQRGGHTHNIPNHDHWNQAQSYGISAEQTWGYGQTHSHTLQGGDARTSGAYRGHPNLSGGSGYSATNGGHSHLSGVPRGRMRRGGRIRRMRNGGNMRRMGRGNMGAYRGTGPMGTGTYRHGGQPHHVQNQNCAAGRKIYNQWGELVCP